MNRDEVIALARKLYDGGKGLSYGKIADKFNADGIPTKTGKGKWEKKMISREIAGDTLRKAEVKTGLKSERETQLESEVESLNAEQNQMLDVISMLRKQNVEMKEMLSVESNMKDDVISVMSRLESENAGLRQDRDEVLDELNRVKQKFQSDIESITMMSTAFRTRSERLRADLDEALNELNTVKHENEELARKESFLRERLADSVGHVNGNLKVIADLNADNDRLKEEVIKYRNMSAGLGADNNRLNRLLNEAELRFKDFYESEITRLGNELAIAKQRIQELQDRQVFIKPESESGFPKNFNGWTVGKRPDGKWNLYRKFSGKVKAIYIGKEWNESDARQKIAAFEQKQKPQSELFAGTDCKSCQHQPEFESRLRAVCPETVRTYRLDTVAKSFHDYDFSREMIALAEQKRIELLAGDPSQCDTSKLIEYRGSRYVNFEWR